jgi:hypothetical protein
MSEGGENNLSSLVPLHSLFFAIVSRWGSSRKLLTSVKEEELLMFSKHVG